MSLPVHLFLSSCFRVSLVLISVLSHWRCYSNALSMLNSSWSLLLMFVAIPVQDVLSLSWGRHSRCCIVLSFWSACCNFPFYSFLKKRWNSRKKELPMPVFELPWKGAEPGDMLHWWQVEAVPRAWFFAMTGAIIQQTSDLFHVPSSYVVCQMDMAQKTWSQLVFFLPSCPVLPRPGYRAQLRVPQPLL